MVPPETTFETSKGMLASVVSMLAIIEKRDSFHVLLFQAQKEIKKKEMNRVSQLLLGNVRRNDAVTVQNNSSINYWNTSAITNMGNAFGDHRSSYNG